MKSKLAKLIEKRLVVARGGKWGAVELGKRGHRTQTSGYKIIRGDVTYSMMTIVSNIALHIKVSKGIDLKILITRKKSVTMYDKTM